MTDEYRYVIGRNLVIGLDVVTEVFQIAIRQHALAAVLLQILEQLRGIDSGHERAVRAHRPRHSREPGGPTTIARHQQREVLHFALGPEYFHTLETTMGEHLGLGNG